MKSRIPSNILTLAAVVCGLWFSVPHAVILDDEPVPKPAAKPKPKLYQKNDSKREVEHLRQPTREETAEWIKNTLLSTKIQYSQHIQVQDNFYNSMIEDNYSDISFSGCTLFLSRFTATKKNSDGSKNICNIDFQKIDNSNIEIKKLEPVSGIIIHENIPTIIVHNKFGTSSPIQCKHSLPTQDESGNPSPPMEFHSNQNEYQFLFQELSMAQRFKTALEHITKLCGTQLENNVNKGPF